MQAGGAAWLGAFGAAPADVLGARARGPVTGRASKALPAGTNPVPRFVSSRLARPFQNSQLRVAAFIKALHEVTRAELHRGFD